MACSNCIHTNQVQEFIDWTETAKSKNLFIPNHKGCGSADVLIRKALFS